MLASLVGKSSFIPSPKNAFSGSLLVLLNRNTTIARESSAMLSATIELRKPTIFKLSETQRANTSIDIMTVITRYGSGFEPLRRAASNGA